MCHVWFCHQMEIYSVRYCLDNGGAIFCNNSVSIKVDGLAQAGTWQVSGLYIKLHLGLLFISLFGYFLLWEINIALCLFDAAFRILMK